MAETPKAPVDLFSKMMIVDSDGNKSASLTLLIIAFLVTTGLLIISEFEVITLGSVSFTPRTFDWSIATTYLSPFIMLYFGRRRDNGPSKNKKPKTSLKEEELPGLDK